MKRRVDIGCRFSESAMVGGRCESYVEKHLRVSNRNLLKRVGLDGTIPLKMDSIKFMLV